MKVDDQRGGTDTQTYTLNVSDLRANHAPFIVSTPLPGAFVGRAYTYLILANDPDGDRLTGDEVGKSAGLQHALGKEVLKVVVGFKIKRPFHYLVLRYRNG